MAAAAALGPLLQALGVGGAGAAAGGAAAAEGAAGGLATEQLLSKLIDRIPQGGEGGRGRGGGSRFGELLSTGKTIALGSSFGEKIGDVIKFGPLGIVVGDLTRRFKAVASIPGQLVDWGDALKESQRHLMAFNGQIAVALVESERRGIIRQIGEGRRTGASTAFLTESLNDLKDELQPIRDVATNVLNVFVGFAAKMVSIGTTLVKMVPLNAAILDIQEELARRAAGETETAWFRFMDGVQKGGLGEFDRKPTKQPRGMG